ncbi:coelenterazine h 2-monooxygenase-like [Dendronephthya gigantea]|uniref:coelenterazine h 2-monooxygenase-like n=1 Tax=Dendronephthya gigantea TaxID=151771 RepID=UPI0010693F80|nr:coelenterazine h 2-monooxygenase-like [Dendronephthya gigantea]
MASTRLLKIARHVKPNVSHLISTRNLITGPKWFDQCKKINVLDSYMSYYDSEDHHSENTIVFLHGNPTSSYLWRNIIPHTVDIARCLAPDLIGMGQSGKSGNGSYRFVDHYKYLSAWFGQVNLPDKVIIVCHDWGSGLGFHWCQRNPTRVKAIVHMESLVGTIRSWDTWPEIARDIFQAIRSDAGEEIILKKNLFVERLLPNSIMRDLTPEEMDAYKMPYKEEGESRRPTLTWPREIPVEGEGPEDLLKIASEYQEFMATSKMPKLFIEAEPGFFSKAIKKIALQWPNTTAIRAKGLHFLQEDSPDIIGSAIREFVEKL